jgi:hypothetical protein
MVDPGAAQAVVRQLNRWYRKRAKPHGTIDHFHRGTRMRHTAVCRRVVGCMSCFLLSIAGLLYFVPGILADKSPLMILLLKIGWAGIVLVAVLMLLQAFREFTVVTDDGLIKSDLFGRETRLGWKEIFTFQMQPDDNKVTFKNDAKAKLTMSLSYDGWQDFRKMAEKHLNQALYWQFTCALANINAKHTPSRSIKKTRQAKRFSIRRSP